MTESVKSWLSHVSVVVVSAFVGAAAALVTFHYQQSVSSSNLRTAFAGEIEAIRLSIGRPANYALAAWEKNQHLSDYSFHFPHAVYDGNVSRLGELGNDRLVRDVAYLYSLLELAREEGRQLTAGTVDEEGMLRYTFFLNSAKNQALRLVIELSPLDEKLRYIEVSKTEHPRAMEMMKKMQEVLLSPPKKPSE